jgi:hypothetical protein
MSDLRVVLDVLLHDGYLREKTEQVGVFCFVSDLIRDWWRKRHGNGHVPAVERLRMEAGHDLALHRAQSACCRERISFGPSSAAGPSSRRCSPSRGRTRARENTFWSCRPRHGQDNAGWRLAFAIEDDPELERRWYPIVAPEEHYDVRSAGDCGYRSLRRPSNAKADADRWAASTEPPRVPDESTLRAQALARLTELAEAEKKRLLVIVENLNMVIGEQVSDDASWDIRKTLQTDPHIMLVGTATVRFEDIANAGKAMYNLFREIKLPPLTQQECQELWKSVAHEDLHHRIRP